MNFSSNFDQAGQRHDFFNQFDLKYKEGNDRPSSVIQISLVQNHDKVGKKYYTKDKTNNRETQVCE